MCALHHPPLEQMHPIRINFEKGLPFYYGLHVNPVNGIMSHSFRFSETLTPPTPQPPPPKKGGSTYSIRRGQNTDTVTGMKCYVNI